MKRKFKVINPLKIESGIYMIKNINDGKLYIGETTNLSKRIVTHFNKLRKGEHPNPIFQNIFNKYGEESFEVYVLEYLGNLKDKNNLRDLESKYQKQNEKFCINFDVNNINKTYLKTSKQLQDSDTLEYMLYNIITGEIKSFRSKNSFSLFFSNKINQYLYDEYCTYIDDNYYTSKEINSIDDLMETDFIFRNSNNYKNRCKLRDYYTALLNYKTKQKFAKEIGVNRHLVKDILNDKSIEERIKEIEKITSHFKTPLNGESPM